MTHAQFITGASRGIGLAIALRAAKDGANVVSACERVAVCVCVCVSVDFLF